MPEPKVEIPQPTAQQETDKKCQDLHIECDGVLKDYGIEGRVKLSDKVFRHITNATSPTPTKTPVNPRIVERNVFYEKAWQKVSIIDVDSKAQGNHQIQIIVGDKPKEFLVMQGNVSWMHINQPYRDINETGIPPPSNRPVTKADLTKYQNLVSLVMDRAIHG